MDILSTLQLVDIEQIRFHEHIEPARLEQTCQAIFDEGLIRHPIIATSLSEGLYLVLDGAHRTHSLQRLGCNKIPIQYVDPSEITMEAWRHLVALGSTWIEKLKYNPTLQCLHEMGDEPPIARVYADQSQYWIYPKDKQGKWQDRLEIWHDLVGSYTQDQQVVRIPQGGSFYPDSHQVLFQYPTLTLEEVKETVLMNQVVPAGVTRCIIQKRILNLKVPLDLLTSILSTKDWLSFCENKVNKFRLYTESIYLCEA